MNTSTTKLFKQLRLLPAIIVATILSACSQLPQIDTDDDDAATAQLPSYGPYDYRATELAKLVQWDVEGKLAVYTSNKNNSGNLTWRQRKEYYDLLITGPLGQGHLHIEGSPGLVIATTADEQTQATSIEALFADHFDWQFPMAELRYWVRGVASPETDAELSFNDSGELATIQQAGWQVEISKYQSVSGLPMPAKITITGPTIRLKLILKNWSNLYPFPRLNTAQ